MAEKKADIFSRNYGFMLKREQHEGLGKAAVGIVGAGGDGYQLALKLAMMGVGEIRIADPEVFELENSNRVLGATTNNIGRNKAQALTEAIEALPQKTKVVCYQEGVTEDNVNEFVQGADLIIDESELRYLHIGTMIARTCLRHSIPDLVVMNVGFAGTATSFPGDKDAFGFQDLVNIPKDAPLDEVAEMKVEYSRVLPYIPPYGDMQTFHAVVDGAPLPTISQGVDMATALGTTEAFLHLTQGLGNHRRSPTWSPKFRYMDAYTNKSGVIRYPRVSHYTTLARMALRSKLGINPKTDY